MKRESEAGQKAVLFGKTYILRKKNRESNSGSANPQLARGKTEEPGSTPHHSDNWRKCVDDVQGKIDQGKMPSDSSPYAICTSNLGPSIQKQNSALAGIIGLGKKKQKESIKPKKAKLSNLLELGKTKQSKTQIREASMLYRADSGDLMFKQPKSKKDCDKLVAELEKALVDAQSQWHTNPDYQLNKMRLHQVKSLRNRAMQAINAFLANTKTQESAVPVKSKMNESGRFLEVISSDAQNEEAGSRFRAVLLQEGLGNMTDCFYYTKEAIASAVPIFEGAKFFVNHPSMSEDSDRPERDVRDIAGYFEKLAVGQSADGCAQLVGDLVLLEGGSFDRERALMRESIDYSQKHPGKDLIGLSINASGDFDEVDLRQFMDAGQAPEGAKEKLLEALQRGVTTIRPVKEMTSAVSCDLVTVAGAGGRINQLLEKEREMQDKKKDEMPKESEDEKMKQAKAKEGEDGDQDAGPHGDHPDAAQDEELIKGLLKKYLGDGFSDDDHDLAREAYQKAKAIYGEDEAEAMRCAGYNIKMAKHLQSEMAQQEKGLDGATDVHSPDPVKGGHPGGPAKAIPAPLEKKENEPMESERVVKLSAELARTNAELAKIRLEKHIDKVLRESKLPRQVTDKFLEAIKGVKLESEVTKQFALFREAYLLGGESEGLGFIVGAEKQVGASGEGLSFSDCVEN